jgi:hypothetical protein
VGSRQWRRALAGTEKRKMRPVRPRAKALRHERPLFFAKKRYRGGPNLDNRFGLCVALRVHFLPFGVCIPFAASALRKTKEAAIFF